MTKIPLANKALIMCFWTSSIVVLLLVIGGIVLLEFRACQKDFSEPSTDDKSSSDASHRDIRLSVAQQRFRHNRIGSSPLFNARCPPANPKVIGPTYRTRAKNYNDYLDYKKLHLDCTRNNPT
ncbi:hypothetical protein NEHOM01_0726 [Nematocida homosporus]|uniref:uncharacterized protein n=1 Tax=Nematocida homosporus TaxID=1912981 RepID=UPI00221F9DCE|nr:uncharacterized protein NEHOM01_0726 [Nematocida homosporus]KAI5185268.1 hypothetical protein NEHOM01_0726 [Nematocida homosporus]